MESENLPKSSSGLITVVTRQFLILFLGVTSTEAQRITASTKPSLQPNGLRCGSTTGVIIKASFDLVKMCLKGNRIPQNIVRNFQLLLKMVRSWLFPVTHRRRRFQSDPELLWSAFNCCVSLLWLRKAHCCRQARAVLQIITIHHRDALCNPKKNFVKQVVRVCLALRFHL